MHVHVHVHVLGMCRFRSLIIAPPSPSKTVQFCQCLVKIMCALYMYIHGVVRLQECLSTVVIQLVVEQYLYAEAVFSVP